MRKPLSSFKRGFMRKAAIIGIGTALVLGMRTITPKISKYITSMKVRKILKNANVRNIEERRLFMEEFSRRINSKENLGIDDIRKIVDEVNKAIKDERERKRQEENDRHRDHWLKQPLTKVA